MAKDAVARKSVCRWKGPVAFMVVAMVLFFLFRLPLASKPPHGEEGFVAHLFFSQPVGPHYNLLARIQGQNVYDYVQHPALSYELIRGLGVGAVAVFGVPADAAQKNTLVRLSFAACQGLVLLALLGALFFSPQGISRALPPSLLLLFLSPFSVLTSLELQSDASSGALLIGALALCCLVYSMYSLSTWQENVLVFCGALISGLGKQEWSLGVFCAALALPCASLFLSRGKDMRTVAVFAGIVLFGNVCGNILSYLFDPLNYSQGLKLMVDLAKDNNMVSSFHPFVFVNISVKRLLANYCIPLVLALSAWFIVKQKKGEAAQFLWLLAAALYAPFMISTWGATWGEVFERYFAPSFIAAVSCLAAVFPPELPRRTSIRFGLAAWSLLLLLTGLRYSFVQSLGIVQDAWGREQQSALSALRNDCTPVLPTGYAYDKPLDFVGNSLAPSDSHSIVARYTGKELCDQP